MSAPIQHSCLYECSVMHHRLKPKEHHFNYPVFMFYLDLDELDSLSGNITGFSRNRFNLYSFRDADHLQLTTGGVKQNVLAYLARNGVNLPSDARIRLLTFPRMLGYVFNPVSFYFCFTPDEKPVCAVAEVGNTFREMKPFLVVPVEGQAGRFHLRAPKHFYVSPFSTLDTEFEFKLRLPAEQLEIHVDDWVGADRALLSTLSGHRAPLTSRQLAWFTLKYPFVTLKVITLIHWHAFLLWRKKIPFFRKAADTALQRDVLNPHVSISGKPL